MAYVILLRRGLKADLPASAPEGELFLTTDTHELYAGTGDGMAPVVEIATGAGDAKSIQGIAVNSQAPADGEILIFDAPSAKYVPGDPIVSGPDAPGAPPTRSPVQVGIFDGTNVQRLAGTPEGAASIEGTVEITNLPNPLPVSLPAGTVTALTPPTPPTAAAIGSAVASDLPNPLPVSAASLPLPAGAAKESGGNLDAIKTALTNPLQVSLPAGTVTALTPPTPPTAAAIGSAVASDLPNPLPVSAASLPLPAGAAKESGGNLDAIKTALTNPLQVSLPAGTVTALTPPTPPTAAAIGSAVASDLPNPLPVSAASLPLPAGAAKESGGNLDAIKTALTNPLQVSLPAGTVTALTPPTPPTAAAIGSAVASDLPNPLPVSAASLPLPAGAAKESGGNLDAINSSAATSAGAVTGGKNQDNVSQWGGTAVTAATATPAGTEISPVVRTLPTKICRVISTTPPTTNATVYYGPLGMASTPAGAGWFDSQQSGATYLLIGLVASAGTNSGSNGYYVMTVNDPANANDVATQLSGYAAMVNAGQSSSFPNSLVKRYWQVKVVNLGATAIATFELTSAEWQGAPSVSLSPATGAQNLDGGSLYDGMTPTAGTIVPQLNVGGSIRLGPTGAVPFLTATGGTYSAFYMQRTAFIFKTVAAVAVTAGTPVAIWTPASGKKFRLMGFSLSLSVAGSILFEDATGVEVIRTPLMAAGIGVPSPDMDNGILSAAANNKLFVDVTASGSVSGFVFGTEE